jgi:hypothetical protein
LKLGLRKPANYDPKARQRSPEGNDKPVEAPAVVAAIKPLWSVNWQAGTKGWRGFDASSAMTTSLAN